MSRIVGIVSIFLILLGCNESDKELSSVGSQKINPEFITFEGEAGLLDIKYSNIIFTTKKNQKIIQPIFRGDKGSVSYEDLREYCLKMGKLEKNQFYISPIIVKCEKNNVKKTFHEFLSFFQTNLLKDIDVEHPTDFGLENVTWVITYDFTYNNIPCYMQIQIKGSERQSIPYKSVYEIQPDENIKWFIYDFGFETESSYKKH